jgi:hypothetical protein
MTKLTWDNVGSHYYEAGVDHGVFYPQGGSGIAWNGLLSVKESTTDTDQTFIYIDGNKIESHLSLGCFAAEISALTYPDEFSVYDGYSDELFTQQERTSFNLSYRTKIGNDIDGLAKGYKLHLVYNALVTPSNKDYTSLGGSVKLTTFDWKLSTTPIMVEGARPNSHFIIDSTVVYPGIMDDIENFLYGTFTTSPHFPSIQEVLDIFEIYSSFRITVFGDGTFEAIGTDAAVHLVDTNTFQLSWPSVYMIDDVTYRASSF